MWNVDNGLELSTRPQLQQAAAAVMVVSVVFDCQLILCSTKAYGPVDWDMDEHGILNRSRV